MYVRSRGALQISFYVTMYNDRKGHLSIYLHTHLKHFIISMQGITYLAFVMQLLCNQVGSRLANSACQNDVSGPQPVRRENKRSVRRVVKRTATTIDELRQHIPLDLFWIRPISLQDASNPWSTRVFKSFSEAAERQSGHRHCPSGALHHQWSAPTNAMQKLPARTDASWAEFTIFPFVQFKKSKCIQKYGNKYMVPFV